MVRAQAWNRVRAKAWARIRAKGLGLELRLGNQ